MTSSCGKAGPGRLEIHLFRGADRFVPVQNGKKRRLPLIIIRFNGCDEPLKDPLDVGLKAKFTCMAAVEIHCDSDSRKIPRGRR